MKAWRRVSTSPPAIGTGLSAAQLAEVVDRVGPQRLLEPADIVVLQHLGGAHRPFAARAASSASLAPGIDEQLRMRRPAASRAARTIASSSLCVERPAERPPADLERAETPARDTSATTSRIALRLLHQQRAVGLHARAVGAAEQPADRQAGGLAEDVPQRDVDAADRMGERAAAAHPEGVLVQLLG